jgi:hypothetical protein
MTTLLSSKTKYIHTNICIKIGVSSSIIVLIKKRCRLGLLQVLCLAFEEERLFYTA